MFTINNLLANQTKLTFLVGAGSSIDPPSCLHAGRAIIEALINYTCVESERKKLLKIDGLRYEQVVEIVRDRLDNNLKMIDYYGECDKPNLQHFFLANMIKNGQFVMTTNFDFLIEHALVHSGIPKDEIIINITRADFETNNDPIALFMQGKKTLYKIHGSTKNIITGEDTRDSLIATIQAFGSGKEGESVFQVEPFKRPLFDNISRGRILVVMGYSGSDDFDIIPTLMVLKEIESIVWINHVQDDDGREKVYEIEINDDPLKKNEKKEKIDRILENIYRMNNVQCIYKVEGNTSRMLAGLTDPIYERHSDNYSVNILTWFGNNIPHPDQFETYYIPYRIFNEFNMIDDAMRCSRMILENAEKNGNQIWKAISLSNIGLLLKGKGDLDGALNHYREALVIYEKSGDSGGKAPILNNIGKILEMRGELDEALKNFEEALTIDEQLSELRGKAMRLINIGIILYIKGNLDSALNYYNQALLIDEKLGDLKGKAMILYSIGKIFEIRGELDDALNHYQDALAIDDQLGDVKGKAMRLDSIGTILYGKGDLDGALRYYEQALAIDEQIDDVKGIATELNNIGLLLNAKGDLDNALKLYEQALAIDDQIGDIKGRATRLNNIGLLLNAKGDLDGALKQYREALLIDEQLGDLQGKATRLNNIGSILDNKCDLDGALNHYQEALNIDEQLGDLQGKATRLSNIGNIHYKKGNFETALEVFNASFLISDKLGALTDKALRLWWIGMIYKKMNNKESAKETLNDALSLYKQIGLVEDAKMVQKALDSL